MGGVSQGWAFWWNYFKSIFILNDFSVTGTIVLGPGLQVIEIPSPYPEPDSVYVHATEPEDETPACIGDINWVATKLSSGGFTLFADIKSNSCTIRYIIRFDANRTMPDKEPKPKPH